MTTRTQYTIWTATEEAERHEWNRNTPYEFVVATFNPFCGWYYEMRKTADAAEKQAARNRKMKAADGSTIPGLRSYAIQAYVEKNW